VTHWLEFIAISLTRWYILREDSILRQEPGWAFQQEKKDGERSFSAEPT
jgi:hypothetical protein